MDATRATSRCSSCWRATRYSERKNVANRFELGEGLVGQCALEKEKILAHQRARRTTSSITSGLGEAPPRNIIVLPVLFEGQVKAVHRAGLVRAVQPDAPGVPRSAHRERSASCSTRSRPTCGPRSCSSSRSRSRRSCRASRRSCSRRNAGAGGEGAAARRAERRGRAQEPRGRAGAPGARGEGRAARADLEVQVRVPRQHVARAAHAAQQPAHPRRSARREPRGQPHRASRSSSRKTIHASGNDLLDADQRHPRPVEDRVGHGARSTSATLRFGELRDYVERTFRHVADAEGAARSTSSVDRDAAAPRPHRRASGCSRSSRTCSPTPSSSPSAGSVELAIEPAPTRLEPRPRGARAGAIGRRVRGHRHRHRHPAGQAADHLRGVPAGRRHARAASTAAPGLGPGDQPRDRAPARRRDPRRRARPGGAARSRSTCRRPTRRRSRRARR